MHARDSSAMEKGIGLNEMLEEVCSVSERCLDHQKSATNLRWTLPGACRILCIRTFPEGTSACIQQSRMTNCKFQSTPGPLPHHISRKAPSDCESCWQEAHSCFSNTIQRWDSRKKANLGTGGVLMSQGTFLLKNEVTGIHCRDLFCGTNAKWNKKQLNQCAIFLFHLNVLNSHEGMSSWWNRLTQVPNQGKLVVIMNEDLESRSWVRARHVFVLFYV